MIDEFYRARRTAAAAVSPHTLLVLKVAAVVLLPAVLLVRGEGYTDWQFAAHQILLSLDGDPNSVYGVADALAVDPRERRSGTCISPRSASLSPSPSPR